MTLPGITSSGQTPNIDTSKPRKPQGGGEKEMMLSEFKTSIFNKWGENAVSNDAKTTLKSDPKIEQFFNSNDTNGVYGLSAQERSKATADVNAYIQNAYSNSVTNKDAKASAKADIDQGVNNFNNMSDEQQIAAMKQEIADIINAGQDVRCIGDGKIQIGGEKIDLKEMGLSDNSVKTIEAEINKHQAEKAQPKNDE